MDNENLQTFLWQEISGGKVVKLAFDDKGKMYIDGKPVLTETKFPKHTDIAVWVMAISTAVIAFLDIVQVFK